MTTSLKERTISGMLWSFVRRSGNRIISFASTLVLARLLTPEDYGIIGMIVVFTSLSLVFIDAGFTSALIQKKEPTREDYSTVFYWNVIISIILYVALFIAAPAIATFYRMPLISAVLRVQGIVLVLGALGAIQGVRLRKHLNFRKLAGISLFSTTIGAVTGIIMAFSGFGVWSLVAKELIDRFCSLLLLWIGSSWRPLRVFSKNSFRELFNYGSLILLSHMTQSFVIQIQSLIIGRVFSARDLGFYTQARHIHDIPHQTITSVIDEVMFPVYSSLQDDMKKVVKAVKISLKSLVFLNFPLMLLLALIAEPLFVILLSDKWIESVPYFQILCFGGMLYSLNTNNVSVIMSLGKSNYVLIATLIKRGTTLLFVFIGLQFGIFGIVTGYTVSMYVWFPVNAYFMGKITGYGISKQIKDIGPNYMMAIAVAFATFLISQWIDLHFILMLIVQTVIFTALYIGAAYVFSIDGYKTYLEIMKGTFNKKTTASSTI